MLFMKRMFIVCDPASRSSWGSPVLIRVQYSHVQGVDEFEVPSHANETMASIRRNIKQQ